MNDFAPVAVSHEPCFPGQVLKILELQVFAAGKRVESYSMKHVFTYLY